MSEYDAVPDVAAYAAQYGAVVNSPPPTVSLDVFKLFRNRQGAQNLSQSNAPINGQLPYTAPQLLTDDQLRWQLGVTVLGGFTGLLLYSYFFKRPLFG